MTSSITSENVVSLFLPEAISSRAASRSSLATSSYHVINMENQHHSVTLKNVTNLQIHRPWALGYQMLPC